MRAVYAVSRAVVQALYIVLFRGRVFGIDKVPRRGGVILASNHQSFLDPMLATLALPRECHYMARDTLFADPRFRRLIETYNAFPVRRGSSDIAAIRACLKRLAGGALITTFPEATRTQDGRVSPCQPGVIVLARKASVPLVPTALEGAFDAWPRHQKLPWRATIWVAYGDTISPEELRRTPREEMAERLTSRIRTLHNRLRLLAGKAPFSYDA
jgi:1-acyl-sn-glycerol-3-phosphate acyltransferase